VAHAAAARCPAAGYSRRRLGNGAPSDAATDGTLSALLSTLERGPRFAAATTVSAAAVRATRCLGTGVPIPCAATDPCAATVTRSDAAIAAARAITAASVAASVDAGRHRTERRRSVLQRVRLQL